MDFDDEDDIDAVLAAIPFLLDQVEDVADNRDRVALHRIQRPFSSIDEWKQVYGARCEDDFRMNREVFQRLVNVIGNHLFETNRLIRLRTPVSVCVMEALSILANPDTFRTVSRKFFTNRSNIHYQYTVIIEALRELAPRYIKWPSAVERDVIKQRFEDRYGYPGVIGAIDGTHIKITAPLEQPRRYINRHHDYSIILQAVCDDRLLYRDIYAGQPGSVGDARTFSRSPLWTNLIGGVGKIADDEHLLGDGAYPLLSQVLTPYLDNGRLTRRQTIHNRVLSSCRVSVENSFGLLKGKFRRLKGFQSFSLQYCLDHIVASCVLHNFIILNGEECPPNENVDVESTSNRRRTHRNHVESKMKSKFS